jgi:hypothetical protein
MRLRTDDDIYRARLVYLGPPGYTLPWQVPYAAYGLFAAVTTVLVTVGWLLTASWALVGVSIGASIFVTGLVWSRVDPDRPARKVLATLATDWRRTPPDTPVRTRLTAGHIHVDDRITP